MAECLVNDIPETLDFRPDTWGELLDTLDRRLAADHRVVTAVRFDGVDQPSFRQPFIAAIRLGQVARVEVEADDAVGLLLEALDAATDSLPDLVAGVSQTAAALRTDAPDAQGQLASLVTALQSLMALTVAAGTAADISFGAAPGADAAVTTACARIEAALSTLVARQTAGDRRAVADALDHHLAPAIAGWTDILTPIRMRAAA
jgi:hypothetical protein